jgi:hypothetical protein
VKLGTASLTQHVRGGSTCSMDVDAPTRAAGTYPVWVSQYGGGEPLVLAGILTIGGTEPTCTQPGRACTRDADCCDAPGLDLACVEGHCRR